MQILKKYAVHIVSFLIFMTVTFAFLYPMVSGKVIRQSDIIQYRGMSKEISDYKTNENRQILWTNAAFSGMPTYQITSWSNGNLLQYLDKALRLGLPRMMGYFFLGFMLFYIMLVLLKVPPELSILGALAFGLTTFSFLILEAGHNTKFISAIYMAPVVIGAILCFRKKYYVGGIAFMIGLCLNIYANHFQITFYILLILLILGVSFLVHRIRKGELSSFVKASLILSVAGLLAIGANMTKLWSTYDYSKETIRGPAILAEQKKDGSGLDKKYAMEWSYGLSETLTVLIPGFKGSRSSEMLGENSATFKELKRKGAKIRKEVPVPLYYGDVPFTGGPYYFGALTIFLFVLSLFVCKGPIKWAFASAIALSVMLAWGRNFEFFSDLFFNYFPMYNKFRAPSTALYIAQFCIPVLATLALTKFWNPDTSKEKLKRALLMSAGITGGLCLLIGLLGPMLFDLSGIKDSLYEESGYDIAALIADRASLMRMDAFRSLAIIALGFGVLWFFLKEKLSPRVMVAVLALIMVVDLGSVAKRYFTNDVFVSQRSFKNVFKLSPTEEQLKKSETDPNYRVLNLTRSPFSDALTSYSFKSIGGYNAAKLRRYNDLIDKHISKMNEPVLNMLNAKYFITQAQDGGVRPQQNPGALGNAWFVDKVKWVDTPNEEIDALNEINPRSEVVIHSEFKEQVSDSNFSNGTINLSSYDPEELVYTSSNSNKGLAVFSEIIYKPNVDWKAYIDGEFVPHIRANYALRALEIPAGNHEIKFVFRPKSFYTGETISMVASLLIILATALGIFYWFKNRREDEVVLAQDI